MVNLTLSARPSARVKSCTGYVIFWPVKQSHKLRLPWCAVLCGSLLFGTTTTITTTTTGVFVVVVVVIKQVSNSLLNTDKRRVLQV